MDEMMGMPDMPEPSESNKRKTAAEQREEEAERIYNHAVAVVEQSILALNHTALFAMTHREKDRVVRDVQKDLYSLLSKLKNSPLRKLPF